MKRSTDRILTTHCGSLARPKDLLDLMKAKLNGEAYDPSAYTKRITSAVADIVRRQAEMRYRRGRRRRAGKAGVLHLRARKAHWI